MKIPNNRWAGVAGVIQWVSAIWCTQIALATSSMELLVPAAMTLLSGSITILGFMKLEGDAEIAEERYLERIQR